MAAGKGGTLFQSALVRVTAGAVGLEGKLSQSCPLLTLLGLYGGGSLPGLSPSATGLIGFRVRKTKLILL